MGKWINTPSCTQRPDYVRAKTQKCEKKMDLRLREITWIRLLSLLVWTILVMMKRGICQLIELFEARVFDISDRIPRERNHGRETKGRTLMPPLSDEIVLERIWPLLHRKVNISLLWRLRRVNKAWREKVGGTVEWAALEMVRVDSPGFLKQIAERCEPRPSLRERVEWELEAFIVLLSERIVDYSEQMELSQSRVESFNPVEGEGERRAVRRSVSKPKVEKLSSGSRGSGSRIRGNRYSSSASFVSVHVGKFQGRQWREIGWSEEEEWEAYASSTDESMKVYYPRHQIKVR